MGFGQAVDTCLSKYFTFSGRARRAEYWYFVLFAVIIAVITNIMDFALMQYTGADSSGQAVTRIADLALTIPQFAVLFRRLHDTDRSGWWVALLTALYSAAAISLFWAGGWGAAIPTVLLLAALAMSVVQLVWLVSPGTEGPNRFGLDPLSSEAAAGS